MTDKKYNLISLFLWIFIPLTALSSFKAAPDFLLTTQSSVKAYVGKFPTCYRRQIQYPPERVENPIFSPFGNGKIYPIGKIGLPSGKGVLTIYSSDTPTNKYGKIVGELIALDQRLDTLVLAESQPGRRIWSYLSLPEIVINTETKYARVSVSYALEPRRSITVNDVNIRLDSPIQSEK